MAEYDIAEINKKLNPNGEKFDAKGGFAVLLAGIAKRLPSIYGENTSKNFAFQVGSAPGEEIAEKILKKRGEKKYEDPIKATIGLFQRLPHYYKVQIEKITEDENGRAQIICKLNSYLDKIYERRPDIERGNILCQINRGYLLTALETLTEFKVKFKHIEVSPSFCKISLTFE